MDVMENESETTLESYQKKVPLTKASLLNK